MVRWKGDKRKTLGWALYCGYWAWCQRDPTHGEWQNQLSTTSSILDEWCPVCEDRDRNEKVRVKDGNLKKGQ